MKNYISQKSFSLSTILIYLFILLCMKDSALGWTTPIELNHNLFNHNVTGLVLGRTLHIINIGSANTFFYMSSWNNGFSWTSPIVVPDTFYQGGDGPSMAADSLANLHIIFRGWISAEPARSQLFHIRSTNGGRTWGPQRQRLFYNDYNVGSSSIAAKGDSLFVICRANFYLLFIRSLNGGGMGR